MKCHPVKCVCFLALGCFLSLIWNNSIREETDIVSLHQRLLEVEAAGKQVKRELHMALKSLSNFSSPTKAPERPDTGLRSVSHTSNSFRGHPRQELASHLTTLQLPNIFSFLPHLKDHADSLTPNIVLGHGRRAVSLVLGVPTVRREKQSYLVNTLGSLLFGLTATQAEDLLIIIFVAETDLAYVRTVADTISKSFPEQAGSGLLEVVCPPESFYPDFDTLHLTLGDSKERVRWRTKQTLDFSFLMLYAQDKGQYYVQLEDDIVATNNYYETMKRFSTEQSSHQWLFLEFSQLGFIGKMFHTHDLHMIAEFFLMFHEDKPVDWLLDHILWVKVCHPEKDAKHCDAQKSLLKRRHKPSLFQHVGLHSSLSGKVQNLKDKDFDKRAVFRTHSNPPAEVSTSLVHYQQHSLERLYRGQDFFWGLTPVRGDHVTISFTQPTHITRYLLRSGNPESHLDKFYNTTIEVLPRNATVYMELTGGSPPRYIGSDNGFIVIGEFQSGVAEGHLDAAMQPVSGLRLVVHSDSDVWVLLSEVFIEV